MMSWMQRLWLKLIKQKRARPLSCSRQSMCSVLRSGLTHSHSRKERERKKLAIEQKEAEDRKARMKLLDEQNEQITGLLKSFAPSSQVGPGHCGRC